MAQSYVLYEVPTICAPIAVPRQLRLGCFEESPETRIDVDVESYHNGFSRYCVLHDVVIRATGRVFHQDFYQYLKRTNFHLYYCPTTKLMIIASSQAVAASFMKTMEKHYPQMTGKRLPIDFDRVRPRLSFISGAWFANLQESHLTSAGLFGPNVHQSTQFKEAERLGRLSSIFVTCEFGDQEYKVMLSSAGSIVLFDRLADDQEALDLILNIKRQLLD